MATRRYERVDDTDEDVAATRHALLTQNDGRLDSLDPLAILELCEEYEVSVTYIIHLRRKHHDHD